MDTLRLTGSKPRMIAHRGVSGIELENTCSAFVAAGNRSYFGIETDVHVTGDGEYIIIHDDRTGRVALDDLEVEKSTYETLRSLRLKDVDGKRGRIDLRLPSLREYVGICRKYEKASVLELKNPMEEKHLDRILGIVEEEGWLERTIFISFDLNNMIHLRRRLPDQKAQLLIDRRDDWEQTMNALMEYRLDLDTHYQQLTAERIQWLHEHQIEVNAWTVDRLEDARRLADWGIDYITSNIIE